MEENAYQAIVMAFSVIVFVIALSVAMYMLSKVTDTSEFLTYNADRTKYYDNVETIGDAGSERYVSTETLIPTLYRYYKENFCVKIYDATSTVDNSSIANPKLVQVLDVNIENQVEHACSINNLTNTYSGTQNYYSYYAYKKLYNYSGNISTNWWSYSDSSTKEYEQIDMFGAPWTGSTDNQKLRIDFLINGDAGYINNKYVDYRNNALHTMIALTRKNDSDKYQFKEQFINYSYSGETMETEDGDTLVTRINFKR